MKKKCSYFLILLALFANLRSTSATNVFKLQPLQSTNFTQLQLNGLSGNNFYLQVSTNLTGWQNLWYDSFQSNSYVFIEVQTAPSATRFYRGVLTNSPIQLELTQSNTVVQVNPMTLVQIGIIGLTTNTPAFVQFYTSNGIVADVPPVQMTSSNIVVSVPPLETLGGAAFTNGLLNARIIQYIGNQAVMSKPFPAVQIQAIAVSKLASGMLTLSFLKASLSSATNILASLPSSVFNNTNTETSLSNVIASLQGMITNVQQAVANPSYTFSLGSISGQPIVVKQQDLQTCDNLLVANLLAISTSDQSNSGIQPLTPKQNGQYSALGPDAASVAQDAINGNDPSADMQKLIGVPQNPLAKVATAFNTTMQVVGGSGCVGIGVVVVGSAVVLGAPAEVMAGGIALSAAMMLSITLEESLAIIGLSGTMSQTNTVAQQLVQSGIQQLEELKYAVVKTAVPQVVGGYSAIVLGAHSLILAFTSTQLTTSVTNETYVGTYTYSETSSSPNSAGCTPDPFIVTSSEAPANAILAVTSGFLLSPGPFSGTLTVDASTLTVTFPSQSCPNGDGTFTTIPGSSVQQPAMASGGPCSGTGGVANPISAAPVPIPGGNATITSSISVAPVTGIVTLTIDIHVTSTSGGTMINAIGHYNLVRQ